MSSLPVLLSLIDDLDRENYSPYYGNDFGLALHPHHIHHGQRRHHRRQCDPLAAANVLGYTLPLNILNRVADCHPFASHGKKCSGGDGDGQIPSVGKDGYQVCMDVAQFKPNELNVKVVDNCVVVEGKHEEREDNHGYISRHFVRRYTLPKDYEADKVVSTLSSDGVLTVSVPKPPAIEDKTSNERVVQIQQVGPAHLNVKQNTQEKIEAGASGNGGDNAVQK